MKNSFGNCLNLTIFGESHGEMIGAVLDGLPAGIEIDLQELERDMNRRKAKGDLSTRRQEPDQVRIVSGFFNGKTAGTALTLLIENTNTRSKDYEALRYRLRPGHADFSAFEKYHGFQDFRGGGHFSGRITAALTAAGSICRQVLRSKGVNIATHIESLHGLKDDLFSEDPAVLKQQMELAEQLEFSVLNEKSRELFQQEIREAAMDLDSVGGVLETAVTGLPAGIGEPFFDSVESELAHLLFSVPAVKGVSFGIGFEFAGLRGSVANDPIVAENGRIRMATNHNGGINGGITNGMPIRIHTVIKPTPSIYKPQDSVDYRTREAVRLEIKGRHDPAIIHRARAVVDCAVAFGLLDLWMSSAAEEYFAPKHHTDAGQN